MPLQVYSTLTRKKEPFHKQPGDTVTMYVCGPTVYKPSHIGHMVGPVIFDTVKRYLTYLGYKVRWVVNITDVDDKLIKRAGELGTTVPQLAAQMTADYIECLKKLNVTGIDELPRATDHIPGMIAMIGRLIDKGYAYAAGGDVYFDIAKDTDYGKLCNRDPEQLEAGARIEVSDRKRNPGDFALWKGAKPGEPVEVQFDSPWGKGRPGWHIECSAMSMEILGETLDIHGGGLDLQFPHHENELAQSESYSDKPFSRVWMHNGLLKMGTAKMAGSVGNVVNMEDLLKHHHSETIRLLLLSTHYRSPIDYNEDRLNEVHKGVEAFWRFFDRFEEITKESFYNLPSTEEQEVFARLASLKEELEPLRIRFFECMDDDFNTGGAVGAVYETLTTLNRFADRASLDRAHSDAQRQLQLEIFRRGAFVLRRMTQILGLFLERQPRLFKVHVSSTLSIKGSFSANAEVIPASVTKRFEQLTALLGELRRDARNAKNYSLADALRSRLTGVGITLVDRPEKTEVALKDGQSPSESLNDELIQLAVQIYDQVRASNLLIADQIRKRLGELGITLEDRPGGTDWRIG